MEKIITHYSLSESEISSLPENICEEILDDCNFGGYKKNFCHANALAVARQLKSTGMENRVVEGVVRLENGFLFEHFWNEFVFENGEIAYSDISLGILGTEEEKNTSKTYYIYKTYSIQEMESREIFSSEIFKAIAEYYEIHPEHKDEYYRNKELIDS